VAVPGGLEGRGAAGELVWRYAAHELGSATAVTNWQSVSLPGAPASTLVSLVSGGPGGPSAGWLLFLDSGGRLIWKRSLGDQYTFGDVTYGMPWFGNSVAVYRAGGEVRIAWSAHHHTWWPGVVVAFDTSGTPRGRFVNAGWIRSLTTTKDGRYLLAAGVSNAFDGSVLAVLDAADIGGTSPPGTLPSFACRDCPAGLPVAYFVMPWSDIAESAASPPTTVNVFPTGAIEVRSQQRVGEISSVAETILELSPSLEIVQRGVSDGFKATHARLQAEGRLDHGLEACPSMTLPIRKWTPGRGWQDVR
jgi:hypothetical protein